MIALTLLNASSEFAQGHLREISGTSQGHLRENSGRTLADLTPQGNDSSINS